MPNLFDTFSLASHFTIDATTRSLFRVSNAIASGSTTFDRILLNDEDIRERARVHKEGVDFDRERLSSLIGKVQQLQARLQASYQSMIDRQMSANSSDVGTDHTLTDKPNFAQDKWKSVGRGAMLFSRAGNADSSVDDTMSLGSNNLGRLQYVRKAPNNINYQERGGFFTALNYLWGFDLHQLRYTYATGTLGPTVLPGPVQNLTNDELFEMDAIDFNKVSSISWKLGQIIPLDPVKVFTPEFQAQFGIAKAGDIHYNNGNGYSFGGTQLYAYVREVDILPDGVTKPRSIDLIKNNFVVDANNDGVPDNTVLMNDFLTSIKTDDLDLTLRGDQWNGNTAPGGGAAGPAGVLAAGQGWKPWNGNTNPPRGGMGGAHIWSGNVTGPSSSFHTSRSGATGISGEIDVLKHNALVYTNFAQADNDDDGMFYWKNGGPTSDPGYWGGGGWTKTGQDSGGSMSWDPTNWGGIQSQSLVNNGTISFSYTGANYFPFGNGSTDNSGQTLNGPGGTGAAMLQIKKINGQDDDSRYVVDRFGNIFDKFGVGSGGITDTQDFYDYIPNILDNAKGNYVGNIFGNNTRVGRKVKLDTTATGANSRTGQDNFLSAAEAKPMMKIASRDYDRPDDAITLAGVGSANNPDFIAGQIDRDQVSIDAFNPQFSEVYLGFSDATQTTVGYGSGKVDKFGNKMNQLEVYAHRTATSTNAHRNGFDTLGRPIGPFDQYGAPVPADTAATINAANRGGLMDRDYNLITVGTKVQIVDNASGVVTGTGFMLDPDPLSPTYNTFILGPLSTGTITGINATTGTYTIAHDDPAIILDPQRTYTVTTVPNDNPRLAGSLENSFVSAVKTILAGSEYKEAIRAGLLEDLMLSASSTDAFGDSVSAKLTVRYNKRQERVELFQNSFAAFFKSGP